MSTFDELRKLTAQARAEGKWLWCHYQDIWFSPDQLDEQNAVGKFIWGPVNWQLRDPKERLAEAKARVDRANEEYLKIRREHFKMSVADKFGLGPKREVIRLANGNYKITVTPHEMSGIKATNSVELTPIQFQEYQNWQSGNDLIQNHLPELSPQQREILMSGIVLA